MGIWLGARITANRIEKYECARALDHTINSTEEKEDQNRMDMKAMCLSVYAPVDADTLLIKWHGNKHTVYILNRL